MAKVNPDKRNPVLSLRMNEAETIRFWNVMDAAKTRNPYADKSDIIRELLGLLELKVLTKEDVNYFQTGKKGKSKNTASEGLLFAEINIEPKKKTGTK